MDTRKWNRGALAQLALGAVGYGAIYMYGHGFVAMTNSVTMAHGWLGMSGAVALALLAAVAAALLRVRAPASCPSSRRRPS